MNNKDAETLLAGLFDYQRFENNAALQSVIEEVEGRYVGMELSDDELNLFAAAGDPCLQQFDRQERDNRF